MKTEDLQIIVDKQSNICDPLRTFRCVKTMFKAKTDPRYLKIKGIKELNLSSGGGARVGQVAVVAVDAEAAQTPGVGGRVSDGVQHLHVPDVVDVERLLQAHHQPRPVELHCQDGVTVAVLTYLRPCTHQ